MTDPFPPLPPAGYSTPENSGRTRRTVLRGAAAAVGVAGAAAFAASETVSQHASNAVASVAATSTRIDLGSAKYGAKGDGSDDSRALTAWRDDILAALDAGAGGVHATIPCGVFAMGPKVTLDILADNVHLEGDSRGGSVLTQLPGANRDILQTRGYSADGAAVSGFSIANLTLDGNAQKQTASRWCCTIRGYNYDIEAVDMLHGGAGGLTSQWTDPGNVIAPEARIRGLGCRDYLGRPGTKDPTYGVLWAGPHDSQFSDCVMATLVAGQSNTGPSFGFVQAQGASGEYLTNVHIWGRHHYGIWADPKANGIRLANVACEGAFLANAVLSSGSSWAGGEAYGTNSQGGQPDETGISLGIRSGAPNRPTARGTTDGFPCTSTIVQTVRTWMFAAPGACVDFTNSQGGNVLTALAITNGSDHAAALHRGVPHAGDEVFLVDSQSGTRLIQRLV